MKQVIFSIGILLAGVFPLVAQSDSGGTKRKEAGRSAWFACTSLPDALENPVKVLNGKEVTEVKLDPYMTSGPVKIQDDGIVRIVRQVPDPEIPAKSTFRILASAKVPDGVDDALIILVPLQKPKDDQVFMTKVQDLASFKGGDRLFINLSGTDIRIKIGDSKIGVAPGQVNLYRAPKLAESTTMPISYGVYQTEQKKWKLLTASTVVVMPTRRQICIFKNGSRIGKIDKHMVLFPVDQ